MLLRNIFITLIKFLDLVHPTPIWPNVFLQNWLIDNHGTQEKSLIPITVHSNDLWNDVTLHNKFPSTKIRLHQLSKVDKGYRSALCTQSVGTQLRDEGFNKAIWLESVRYIYRAIPIDSMKRHQLHLYVETFEAWLWSNRQRCYAVN